MPPGKKKSEKGKPGQGKSARPGSREAQRVQSRASTASTKAKESTVLTDGSLSVLAREIGADNVTGIVLCMYLNIPTSTIVYATNCASETGLLNADDATKIETTLKLLLIWKSLRVGSKDKDKVRDLEKALREMGRPEWAEAVNDRHANQVELTPDAFSV